MDKVILIGTSIVTIVATLVALNRAGQIDKKIEIGTLMLAAGAAGAGAVMALEKTSSEMTNRLNEFSQKVDERLDRIEQDNVKSFALLEAHSQRSEQSTQMLQRQLEELRRHVDERLQLERTITEAKIELMLNQLPKNDRRWCV